MNININISKLKILFGSLSLTTLLVMLIVGANLLSLKVFHRFDLTQEQTYTISKATIRTLRELDQQVKATFYVSNNLPPNYKVTGDYVRDVLQEYQKYGSNLIVETIDPSEKTESATKASELGIEPVQFQILDKDEFKVQKGYMGISFSLVKDDKQHDEIPFIQSQEGIEYEFTTIIKKLTSKELSTIAFTSGHEEFGFNQIPPELLSQLKGNVPNGEYSTLDQALSKNYTTKTVDLKTKDALNNVKLLIIGGPKTDFDEKELATLDQYLRQGGNVIFLVDSVNVDIANGLKATAQNQKLIDFVSQYGVTIGKNLVIDKNNETVGFTSGNAQYYLAYPYWVKTLDQNMNKSLPVTAKLPGVSFPFVSSLEVKAGNDLKIQSLISSSSSSSTVVEPFNLAPNQQISFDKPQPYDLAVYVEGSGESFKGKMFVVGDADFVTNNFLQRAPSNLNLVLNMVDFLAQDPDLISIRAKTPQERTIRKAEASETNWIRVINGVIIPLVILAFGVYRYQKRKKS
jgi:gliding-associated putative ABC transporter substrate-binding component GldG